MCIQMSSLHAPTGATKEENKETVKKNIKKVGKMIGDGFSLYKELVPPKLVAFPEGGLGQYSQTFERKTAHRLVIPGEETDMLGEFAKKYKLYIVGHADERDPKYEEVKSFSCAFVINPKGKVILKYRKVNPWIPLEDSTTSPHDILDKYKEPLFPVVETEIGNIGCYICYDMFFPEVARQLTINGAEILVKPTAFCAPWWSPPLEYFQLFNRVRCIENLTYGVNPNIIQHGVEGGWHVGSGGASMIVDYEGRPLVTGPIGGSEVVIGAPISIDALRQYRKSKLHNSPKHLRTEAYDYLKKTIYPPNKLPIIKSTKH